MTAADSRSQHHPDLWLVRHGQTEWSRDMKHTSSTDLPLTERGEEVARELRGQLAGTRFDLVLSSPLRRARDTARLAGFADPVLEPDAVEWDYGDAEGRTTQEIRETIPDWTVWTHGPPGGETADEVGARCDRVIARVRAEASERAILFAHGHLLRVLAARWLGLAPTAGAHFELDTATISVLSWERTTPAVKTWNA